jgi:hypothetical protein
LSEAVRRGNHRSQLLETHFRSSGTNLFSYEIIYKLPPLFVLKGFVFGHIDSVRMKFSITRPRTSLGSLHREGQPSGNVGFTQHCLIAGSTLPEIEYPRTPKARLR